MSETIARSEGVMDWGAPSVDENCRTWYEVYGDLTSGRRPLVVLHGGPGACSDYVSTFSYLAVHRSIPIVIYDQVGNGRSAHFTNKPPTFWTEQLFLDELKHLLTHLKIYEDYDLLGHSWGGMLASRHAVRQAGGLTHLVLASSPASMPLWVDAQQVHRKTLEKALVHTLDTYEEKGETDNKEYEAAVNIYYSKFLCRKSPFPEELMRSFEWLQKDPTVYVTMNGPNEFYVTGSLQDWSILDEVHKINVPTLLTNGKYDEAADSCVEPLFKLIPRVKWRTFSESAHMPHLEEPEEYFNTVANFLNA